jgi:hypothetical protein
MVLLRVVPLLSFPTWTLIKFPPGKEMVEGGVAFFFLEEEGVEVLRRWGGWGFEEVRGWVEGPLFPPPAAIPYDTTHRNIGSLQWYAPSTRYQCLTMISQSV